MARTRFRLPASSLITLTVSGAVSSAAADGYIAGNGRKAAGSRDRAQEGDAELYFVTVPPEAYSPAGRSLEEQGPAGKFIVT